jgi:predicted MFS family arabinose efflux permease
MTPTTSKTAVRRLAAARLISVTGGAACYTALMFTVYQLTHSPTWLSATLLLTFGVSGFVAPLAGALGDRFDRRRVMIVSDLLGVGCFAAMAFTHDPGWLLGLAFASAVVETPFWSASGAAIPNLVSEEDLSWANGLIALGRNSGIMVGPAIGGLLLASVGSSWVFGLNALSFVFSAFLVWSVRGRSFSASERDDSGEHKGLRAGFVFLSRDRILRIIVLAWVTLVLGMGLVMVADVPLTEHFHAGSLGYGLLITCWGGGSVLGSLAGRKLDERKELRALFWGVLLIAFSTGAIAVSPWFPPILLMAAISGFGDAITLVAEQGIQQRRTPDAVRSRVMSAADAIITVSFALSLVVSGVVLRAVGPQNVYAIGGLTALAGAVVLMPVFRAGRETEGQAAMTEAAIEPTAGG